MLRNRILKKAGTFVVLTAIIGASGATYAQGAATPFGISAKAGDMGAGIDLTYGINEYFKLRGGYSQMDFSRNFTSNGSQFNGKLKLGGWDLLVDAHPFANGFRITAGGYIPTTQLGLTGATTGAGSYTINGNTYSTSQVNSFDGSAKYSGVKPYLGLGYDGFNSATNGGLYFTSDVGVIFSGAPKVTLSANCSAGTAASTCAQLSTDIAAQQQTINSTLSKYNVLPVLQLGVGYRF
jgi:hypothetical protein